MNSYMRRSAISADQMHSFLKDKQAWENAIAMYQGPDPLDHWYNYICWYENNCHGDPENKFRETLERCLTLYEHSEYYKLDPRMVRLWIKYIDMQQNQLHFYQILYQRGVGRQCAAFYISWARYYESVNAFKEAESVFNLAFQEKAQPYMELQNAHTKLLYERPQVAATLMHEQKLTQQQQQQIQQQQQQQLQQQHVIHHHKVQHHIHYQQQHQQQMHLGMQQQHHLSYQQHPSEQIHKQQHADASHQQMHYHENASNQQHHHHIHYQNQLQIPVPAHHHEYFLHEARRTNSNSIEPPTEASVEYLEQKAPTFAVESQHAIEQELPAAIQHNKMMPAVAQDIAATKHQNDSPPEEVSIGGIKLPRKFAHYCHNNYEMWKPALFLEEPPDPNRHCHYAKDLVYPGSGVEYSPEELRARKWRVSIQKQHDRHSKEQDDQVSYQSEDDCAQPIEVVPGEQSTEELYNSQCYTEQLNEEDQEQRQCEGAVIKEGDLEEDEYDEDDKDSGEDEKCQDTERVQPLDTTVVHTMDDIEDQIVASTIRFSTHTEQGVPTSKTIKIKFKKESKTTSDSQSGTNYSSYTIENNYQQEELANTTRSNGQYFHPYSISHSSTPKTNSKRSKSKVKAFNKFRSVVCNNSNSSSADCGASNSRGGGSYADMSHIGNDSAIQNASFNDNANFSFCSATNLDYSNCSVASGVDRLNLRETQPTNAGDFSTYQENSYFTTQNDTEAKERRLKKALEAIERHLAKEAIDPFNGELCRAFLTKVNFPEVEDSNVNYKIIQTPLPKMSNTRTITLSEGVQFNIDKEVGRGSYGSVYKAVDVATGAIVALKYQKPPNTWEIYICDQVLKRIKSPHILPGFMDISTAVIAPNASIIATEFSPFGSLLDINNKIRQATTKVMHESLVMHFSSQICTIIHHLHINKIIHADIKPDNFLLMRVPNTELYYPSLRLIDFGCAIDMLLFADPDTKFRKTIQTDGFTCVEMQEGRPWSYETDLFCVAGTVHVMLFGEYMQLQKRGSIWDIKQKLPRYLKKHVWTKFFGNMLNIKEDKFPDLNEMRLMFDEEVAKMDSELQSQIRALSNILHRR